MAKKSTLHNKIRSGGILLHPTSLPATAGIGTLGKQAFAFVDWLEKAQMRLWQVLPLGPTGYGDSPYASFSTFAGNPLLIDIDLLREQGYLNADESKVPNYIKSKGNVDFGSVVWWKIPLLKLAAGNFLDAKRSSCEAQQKDRAEFKKFCKKNAFWLETYALFMSIKEFYDKKAQDEKKFGAMWSNYWPAELAQCDDAAIKEWKDSHSQEILAHQVIQYFFFTQWAAVKNYANSKGISIIGDIPIFVASDSADVWANQRLFQLDKKGRPLVVAGVPPDYFSATGQLWGNPLYDWAKMKESNYEWWIQRIKSVLNLVDYVRIDHFRGFEAYWAVPAKNKTAEIGKWLKGPDHDLFNVIQEQIGTERIIAEDLGVITDKVRALRDDFNLPGMKILQFAFNPAEKAAGSCTNSFLPHTYAKNCVVYTGTHDNTTSRAWAEELSPEEFALVQDYLGIKAAKKDLAGLLVRMAFASVADFAIIPLQDVFNLGKEARMNEPSTSGGTNWQWRMDESHFSDEKAAWLKELTVLYAR